MNIEYPLDIELAFYSPETDQIFTVEILSHYNKFAYSVIFRDVELSDNVFAPTNLLNKRDLHENNLYLGEV